MTSDSDAGGINRRGRGESDYILIQSVLHVQDASEHEYKKSPERSLVHSLSTAD